MRTPSGSHAREPVRYLALTSFYPTLVLFLRFLLARFPTELSSNLSLSESGTQASRQAAKPAGGGGFA